MNKKLTITIIAFVGILLFAIAGAASVSWRTGPPLWVWLENLFTTPTSSVPAAQSIAKPAPLYKPVADYEQAVVRAVEQAVAGTVSVIIAKNLPVVEQCSFEPFGDLPPEFRQFFGAPLEFSQPCVREGRTEQRDVGGGSGFVADASGLVVTNKHVILDKDASYTVIDSSGKRFKASVVAIDPVADIGFLKIEGDGSKLKPLELGDSDSLKLGQTVIAVGNALGEFRNTVSVGVVSGLSRRVTATGPGIGSEVLQGVIQTDAAINRGNSGGPLLNLRGEVIGINVAMAQGSENIGFAIPINQVKRSIISVKQKGKISVPYLGVRYIMLTEEVAKRDNLSASAGALLRGNDEGPAVIPDSPAAKAGLLAEDIVLEVNGAAVDADQPLLALLQKYQPGDAITLKIRRGAKTLTTPVVLEERKQ